MHNQIKVIPNRFIPFKGFLAINLFGTIFIRKSKKWWEANKNKPRIQVMLNHERIHSLQAQQYKTKWFAFYFYYILEWIKNLFRYKFDFELAYYTISFEIEAYGNEHNFNYTLLNK